MSSEDFVQFNFPCKDCMVLACCREAPKDNKKIEHLYDKLNTRCLAVPKFSSDIKSYSKGLIECWANLGVGIINSMQKSEDPQTCTEINNNIPMQYVQLLGKMSYLIQWIINSTSWEKGQLQEFDAFEIRLKSKTITL